MTGARLFVAVVCPYCAETFPINADTIDDVRDHVDACGDDAAE